ncbi:MAG TPA: ABC transporter substrate-binding protein [Acetobacteraceae bacterium]|jgi:phospholipid transport system substrate-binding protein
MSSRRTFILFAAVSVVPAIHWLNRPASAQGATGRASAFIKNIGDQLVGVVNGPESDREKRSKLTAIIDNAVDVDGVARFCLGRFWRTASPEQQHRYMALFHQVLVNNITAKIGEYRGVRFQMGRTQQRDDDAVVSTVVERPNNPPTNVDWVVSNPGSDPKIIDVVAEGTSLRLTQRQDYASYLSHNNNSIDALIDAMRQQVAEAG